MTAAEQRLADLEQQLADLTARFEQLERDAFYVKTLEEMALERAGYSAGKRAIPGPSRPRHLHLTASGAVNT